MNTSLPCRFCGGTHFFKAIAQGEALLPLGFLHSPKFENLICGDCGHTEWFVSQQHLHLVREKLRPANGD